MKFLYILPFIVLIALAPVAAQQELNTHFMRDLAQSAYTNPAFITKDKWTLSLPSFYFNFNNSEGTYNDIIRTEDGKTILDLSDLIHNLSSHNSIQANVAVQTLGIGFRQKKWHFSIGHAIKMNSYLSYPKELADLVWNGNATYIGETVAFAPKISHYSYSELALGVAYQFSNISIGARFKYLSGINSLVSNNANASVFTSDDIYQLTFQTDYELYTTNLLEVEGASDFTFDFNNMADNLFSSNRGFALDLGLNYQVDEDWTVAISLSDLGNIQWNTDSKAYRSQGEYTYEGVDLSDFVLSDSLSFDVKLDTLETIFAFEESAASYKTILPTKAHFSVHYQMNDRWNFGGLYYVENSPLGMAHTMIAVSARTKIIKQLTIGAIYAVRNNDFNNLGLNLTCQFGPVQLYGMTDNIISVFSPSNSRKANARIGLNLVW